MKNSFVLFAALALSTQVFAAAAPAPALSQETLEDIAKHETIAAAHRTAAQCLREGRPDAVCEGALLQACKGVAIGKFCGMKH